MFPGYIEQLGIVFYAVWGKKASLVCSKPWSLDVAPIKALKKEAVLRTYVHGYEHISSADRIRHLRVLRSASRDKRILLSHERNLLWL